MNFLTKYKKIFLLIGFLLIIFVWSYIIYFLFFKSQVPVVTDPDVIKDQPSLAGGLPIAEDGEQNITGEITNNDNALQVDIPITKFKLDQIARGQITTVAKLTDAKVSGITISKAGNTIQLYNSDDGKFYKIDKDGNAIKLSDKQFYNVEKVSWSPEKNKAIIEYPDGSNIVYDFDTERQVTLPKHWEDFNFSENGDKIVMKSIGLDPDNRWLAITNDDGSKSEKIERIGINADNILPSWSPNNQIIAMQKRGIDFDRQEIIFLGLNNENFKSTKIEGRGFEPLWTPKGDRLLYSVYSSTNNMKPKLWIVDALGESIGNNKTDLNIETWAHKCTFSGSNTLYCAVPKNLEEGAGVFPELSKQTYDTLYKINTSTGLKRVIAIPDGNFNISQLIISEGEKEAYFTDETTQQLHKIQLK